MLDVCGVLCFSLDGTAEFREGEGVFPSLFLREESGSVSYLFMILRRSPFKGT